MFLGQFCISGSLKLFWKCTNLTIFTRTTNFGTLSFFGGSLSIFWELKHFFGESFFFGELFLGELFFGRAPASKQPQINAHRPPPTGNPQEKFFHLVQTHKYKNTKV